jgi:hypothetical protein
VVSRGVEDVAVAAALEASLGEEAVVVADLVDAAAGEAVVVSVVAVVSAEVVVAEVEDAVALAEAGDRVLRCHHLSSISGVVSLSYRDHAVTKKGQGV